MRNKKDMAIGTLQVARSRPVAPLGRSEFSRLDGRSRKMGQACKREASTSWKRTEKQGEEEKEE